MPRYNVGTLAIGSGDPEFFRHNDGSLIILDGPAGDARPCLLVPRVHHVPRNKAYSAPDADQEAFAQRVVDLLNQAEPAA